MTIMVVGDANADLTAVLTRFPHEGDDSPVSMLHWGSGGSSANTAAGLALLGQPTRLLARVGSDPAADVALRVVRDAGVDLRAIQADPTTATGLCYAAISPSGERTFFAFRGANVQLAYTPGMLNGITWIHLGGHALLEGRQHDTARALLSEATTRGIPVSLDLCLPLLRARRSEVLQLLPQIRMLFANAEELRLLAVGDADLGDAPDQLAAYAARIGQLGVATVIGKCGADGCVLVEGHQIWQIAGFPVVALDTNGCGDAFAAGFLDAWCHGYSLMSCARAANACGAIAATRVGAAEALPNAAELESFLAERDVLLHQRR
jgi:sugar/nucleoside kinase (ribokinase family)